MPDHLAFASDPRPWRNRCVFGAVLLALSACRGSLPVRHYEESPAGSDTWRVVAAVPTWVAEPPTDGNHVRIVATASSNVRSVALANLPAAAGLVMQDRIVGALRTVVPAPVAAAAGAVATSSMRLVQRACREEVLTRDLVPGNTLATVFGLYELPIADLLPHVETGLREVVATRLAR